MVSPAARVKIVRALRSLAEDHLWERTWPSDHDIGIDRSGAASLEIAESGIAPHEEARLFIEELIWLGDELERVFPKARAFVRPGVDEPDDVARLRLAVSGGD